MQIDLLKAIGLLLIILAHVKPNSILLQIRIFDVPLMVLVSGYLAQASYERAKTPIQYYIKRFMRLYVPTFLFLTFFFIFFNLTTTPPEFSINKIARSYALLFSGTIGYVWIIRVFLLCALITPAIVHFQKYLFSKIGIAMLVVVYALYEFSLRTVYPPELFKEIVYYAIGYGMILILGMALHHLSNIEIYKISILCGCIHLIIAGYLYYTNGHYIQIQKYKYPPQLYYLSYSVCISYFLYAITVGIHLKEQIYKVFRFISRYSLSIYLWHIFFLFLINLNEIIIPWYTMYAVVLLASSLTAFATNMIFNKLRKFW